MTIVPAADPRTEAALHEYAIEDADLDGDDADLQDLVRLAQILCGAPMAFLSLVGPREQNVVARVGMDLERCDRDDSFCAFTAVETSPLVVPDAGQDVRFAANRFVTGAPHIRFYAGAPLRSPEGVPLGAFCVADTAPRAGLTEDQAFGLRTLAAQAMRRLESRRRAAWRKRADDVIANPAAIADFVGFWDWSLPHSGAADAAAPDIRAFLENVHEADRPRIAEAIGASLSTGDDLRAEYRTPAGRWFLARGRPLRVKGGGGRFAGVLVDITERKQTEAALAESEAKFRAIADTLPQMVWSTLPDGRHDYYNARWYEFTGVPEGSTDGDGWNGMFHPDDQDRAWARWRQSLESGEPYEIEYRLRHHSGHYRWTLGRALPIRDEAGRITRWFGTCTDIHDARTAAEERELVAQELSHRIKNTFLVISGLISLSARADPTIRPFADQLRERIAALGRAHNFVRPHSRHSRPESLPTTAHNLFGELFAPYQLGGRRRILVAGDDLDITDRAATPLALLLHELATNAAKYGALAADGGVVRVTTRLDGETYRLEWEERGGPVVTAPTTDGFGMRLSRLSVEAQLGGSLERQWLPEGLRVLATMPVASIGARPAERRSIA